MIAALMDSSSEARMSTPVTSAASVFANGLIVRVMSLPSAVVVIVMHFS